MIISQAVHTGLKPEVPRLVPKCAMSGRKSVTPQFASILADLEIEAVDIHVRRGPGKICATRTTERLLIDHGTGHLILMLRTIMESENNRMELVAPTSQYQTSSSYIQVRPTLDWRF
jgi:hypothetical protein